MAPKKHWKKKYRGDKQARKFKQRQFSQNQDGRVIARHAIEDIDNDPMSTTTSPVLMGSDEAPNLGQALARTPSKNDNPWHNPSDSHSFPPELLSSRPPFDSDGIHPARRSLVLTEYEGRSVEVVAPMMAPGHDQQQQRNHQQQQPPQNRPHLQQNLNQQRPSGNPNDIPINGEHQQRNQHAKDREIEREQPQRKSNGASIVNGPMPSHIQVAKPYVFQQAIEGCLKDVGVSQAREDNIRLAGVQWIDTTRRALKLPVRTFDTAVVYYHKFRLVHSDGEYSFVDAAAAALFAACKIEDTLKKSRDILCAAHNSKVPRNEHLSPDDAVFEHPSRTIIGLERLMLEASSFDFRNRHPQTLMIKIAKYYNISSPASSPLVKTAYTISLDLYRTFAPLKQSTATLAFACLELAYRLHSQNNNREYESEGTRAITRGYDCHRWGITRAEVMETLLDLLELYTHYRPSTTVGPEFPIDDFLEVRIALNEELNDARLPRFTEYIDTGRSNADPAGYAATVNGVSAAHTAINGTAAKADTKSPASPSSAKGGKANGMRQKAGERGREGTVRFMLNPDRERQERMVIAEYHPQSQPKGQTPSQIQTQTQAQASAPTQPQPQSQSQRPSHTPTQPQGPSGGSGRGRGYHGPGSFRGGGSGPRPGSSGRGERIDHANRHGHDSGDAGGGRGAGGDHGDNRSRR